MWLNIRLSWKITKIRLNPVSFTAKTGTELTETGVLFLLWSGDETWNQVEKADFRNMQCMSWLSCSNDVYGKPEKHDAQQRGYLCQRRCVLQESSTWEQLCFARLTIRGSLCLFVGLGGFSAVAGRFCGTAALEARSWCLMTFQWPNCAPTPPLLLRNGLDGKGFCKRYFTAERIPVFGVYSSDLKLRPSYTYRKAFMG